MYEDLDWSIRSQKISFFNKAGGGIWVINESSILILPLPYKPFVWNGASFYSTFFHGSDRDLELVFEINPKVLIADSYLRVV